MIEGFFNCEKVSVYDECATTATSTTTTTNDSLLTSNGKLMGFLVGARRSSPTNAPSAVVRLLSATFSFIQLV